MSIRLLAMVFALVPAVTSGASGQVIRPAADGITVVGRSTIRVRPDILRFTARFSLRPPSMDALLSQVDQVSQAFVKAGIDADTLSRDVGPIYGPSQGIELTINGSANPAPAAQLAATYQRVMASVASVSGLSFQNFNATFGVKDCTAAEEQARKAAVADAHRRALAVAQDEGVTLGAVQNVSETLLAPLTCSAVPQFQNGALDMSPQPMVNVGLQISVTYEIRPSLKASQIQKPEARRVVEAPARAASSHENRSEQLIALATGRGAAQFQPSPLILQKP